MTWKQWTQIHSSRSPIGAAVRVFDQDRFASDSEARPYIRGAMFRFGGAMLTADATTHPAWREMVDSIDWRALELSDITPVRT